MGRLEGQLLGVLALDGTAMGAVLYYGHLVPEGGGSLSSGKIRVLLGAGMVKQQTGFLGFFHGAAAFPPEGISELILPFYQHLLQIQ